MHNSIVIKLVGDLASRLAELQFYIKMTMTLCASSLEANFIALDL